MFYFEISKKNQLFFENFKIKIFKFSNSLFWIFQKNRKFQKKQQKKDFQISYFFCDFHIFDLRDLRPTVSIRLEHTKQLTVEMRGGGENPKYSETMTADERDLVAKIGDIEDDEYALKMKKMKWLAVFNCIMSSLVFISQK